jgi:concanavalin A-like lectin/glucanase superfamily protein
MAVRFDAAADRLLRTTSLINYNNPYSWMCWFYFISDLNAFGSILQFDTNDSGTSKNEDQLGMLANGTTLNTYVENAGFQDQNSITLVAGTWYHFALVRESTTALKTYVNGSLSTTNTLNVSGRTAATRMEVGGSYTANTQRVDGRVYAQKAWTTALTLAQVVQEMRVIRPRFTASLYGWWPHLPSAAERLKDYSGQGHDWTAGGTLTDEAPYPVPWGGTSYFVFRHVSATLEQEGYRFRNADGDEAGASWMTAQDTPISVARNTPFRLRVLANAVGDPPNQPYTLKVRKQGSGGNWNTINKL